MLGIGASRDLPTVLIIDDDMVSREVMATVLTMTGYTIHTAAPKLAVTTVTLSVGVSPAGGFPVGGIGGIGGIGGDGVEMTARESIKVEGFTVDTQFQPIEANSKGPRCALARPDQERV